MKTNSLFLVKLMSRIFCVLFLAFVAPNLFAQTSVWDGTQEPFVNGNGTQSNPYLIEKAQHLAHLAYLVNNGIGAGANKTVGTNTYYKMMININLNGSESFQWTPIGYYNSDADQYFFGGNLDGNGKTIANLYISSNTLQRGGLFGMMNGGSVKNVGIIGSSTIKTYGYTGAIVAYSTGNVLIENVKNVGSVYSTSYYSGGIVGYNDNSGMLTINNSYNNGIVTSYYNCSGGIVGFSEATLKINNCYNTGQINGGDGAGGIVGICGWEYSLNSNITNCYNIGVSESAIMAYGYATVTNTYYLNTCSNNNYYGGISKTEVFMKSQEFVDLLGYAFKMDTPPLQNNGYPVHSGINFNMGTVEISNITSNSAKLKISYSYGNLTIIQKGFQYKKTSEPNYISVPVTTIGDSLVHTITGLIEGTDYTCRAFIETSEIGTIYSNTNSFLTLQIPDLAPWDGITIKPVTPIGNTYYIYSPTELAWIAQQCNTGSNFAEKTIEVMNDLDLGGKLTTPSTWIPIGTEANYFLGSFNGNYHIIKNLYHNASGNDNAGLFGYIKSSYFYDGYTYTCNIIKNIQIHNAYIVGKNNIGGIVGVYNTGGYCNCIISNCCVFGYLQGTSNTGGIVGYIYGDLVINNSYYNGNIVGTNNLGGIAGNIYGYPIINACYSAGYIKGVSQIGGLIGSTVYHGTKPIVNNSFSTSTLNGESNVGGIIGSRSSGTFTNCYFDKQMAGTNNGVGSGEQTGTSGKLTSEMTTNTAFGMGNNTDPNYPSNWVYTTGLYPQLNIFESQTNADIQKASKLSVAPVFLQNNETSAGVSTNFTLSTANSVTWKSSVPQAIGINGGNATVSPMIIDSVVTLTASLGGLEKKIRLNVVGSDTILIYSKAELLLVANQCNNGVTYEGKYLKLMNDIVLEENVPNNMISIGNYETNRPFMGTFNGNGKIIKNLYIDKPNNPYQGFFGYTKNAHLYEVGLIDITASGRNYTGGMVAYAENTYIKDSYVNGGTLFALTHVGGLVGYQAPGPNSVISGCWNACAVSATKYVGGLVGYSDNSTVRNSYVIAPVNGQDIFTTGGIIGGSKNVLMYYCWFSIEITGQTDAIGEEINGKGRGGEGLTNAEMQTQEFVNKLNQALIKAVFRMDYAVPINNKFPILIWQRSDIECGKPANLMVNEVGNTQVLLSWQGGSNNYYVVEYTKTGGAPQTKTTNTTSITLTGLDTQSEYSWRVKSVCTYGESEFVQGVKFKTGTVGIKTYQEDKFVFIYPNPATTQLHIKLTTQETVDYAIFNIMGQTMLQGKLQDESTINIESLTKGIYFLKILSKENAVIRFLKQ